MKTSSLRSITLAVAVAVGTSLGLAACGATPTRESPGQYIDDATITTKVKSAFVADKTVSAMDVKVETYKGTVQLSGFANNQTEINQAVAIARGVTGVQAVKNDIKLKAAQ
jgi:hyperosmotically inducible protein